MAKECAMHWNEPNRKAIKGACLAYLSSTGRWLAAFALGALLAACGGGSGGGAQVATTAAEPVSMPRAAAVALPADAKVSSCSYEHLYLTVVSLRLRLSAGSGEAWHDVSLAGPQRIDLMHLSGGLLDALRAAPLPAGRYTEVRLMLASGPTANAVQPSGGTLMPLSVPGGAQSGLKLVGNFDVPSWRSGDIVPDGSSVCASLVKAANSGVYQLKPEIEARIAVLPTDQEHRIDGDQVVALPGGGFAALRHDATGATVQRHGPDGSFAGSEIHIRYEADPSTYWNVLTPLAGGGYVLTWFRLPTDGPGPPTQPYRLMVQRYDAKGTPLGAPQQPGLAFPFAISHTYPGTLPTTAALTGGGFVIVWRDVCCYYSLRYGADGSPVAPAQTLNVDYRPRVLALTPGGFMVAWGLSSISAVAYGADGAAVAPAQFVGSTLWNIFSSWTDFAVAALATGGAVVAWTTEVSPSNAVPTLYVRRLAGDASPLGDPISLGASTIVTPPSVAGLDDGGFVVSWLLDGHVYGARFAADGSPTGAVTRLDAITTSPTDVSVVTTGSGGFLVSWSGVGSDGQRARYGRLFDPNGLLP
jgi:hypothetical protein